MKLSMHPDDKNGIHKGCGGNVKDGCCDKCGADFIPGIRIKKNG